MATKKEICIRNKSFAYYSGFSGLEFRHIEYGINDYIYAVSGAWSKKPSYHKLKIHYGNNENHYIMLHGYRISLSDCVRM